MTSLIPCYRQYTIDNELNGIMFWEITNDKSTGGLLDAIYNVKTSYKAKKK
jgi:GH18 family chitinase